jgi:hypothetical protein
MVLKRRDHDHDPGRDDRDDPGAGREGRDLGDPPVPDPVPPPATTLTALLPATAAIGDPSFTLRVIGSGFDETSVIVFAGQDEPTTYTGSTELTTGVDMRVWVGPDPAVPVLVRTGTEETATLTFAFAPPREVPLDPAYASKPSPVVNLITPV